MANCFWRVLQLCGIFEDREDEAGISDTVSKPCLDVFVESRHPGATQNRKQFVLPRAKTNGSIMNLRLLVPYLKRILNVTRDVERGPLAHLHIGARV
jgi:hypothetical protein